MIPVLGVPIINRPDLLARMIRSIDHAVDRLIIIDNSNAGCITDDVQAAIDDNILINHFWVVSPFLNMGVAASWNSIIKMTPDRYWWCISNADTEFGPGDLKKMCDKFDGDSGRTPKWVGIRGDWRFFGINQSCVEKVGMFDENFYPIYCEDADYERRCTLMNVPWYFIDGTSSHVGSVSWRSDTRNAQHNQRTYPQQVAYYEAKWGGHPRGGERFTTPFDQGLSPAWWSLEYRRVRDNAWL